MKYKIAPTTVIIPPINITIWNKKINSKAIISGLGNSKGNKKLRNMDVAPPTMESTNPLIRIRISPFYVISKKFM